MRAVQGFVSDRQSRIRPNQAGVFKRGRSGTEQTFQGVPGGWDRTLAHAYQYHQDDPTAVANIYISQTTAWPNNAARTWHRRARKWEVRSVQAADCAYTCAAKPIGYPTRGSRATSRFEAENVHPWPAWAYRSLPYGSSAPSTTPDGPRSDRSEVNQISQSDHSRVIFVPSSNLLPSSDSFRCAST